MRILWGPSRNTAEAVGLLRAAFKAIWRPPRSNNEILG